MENRLPINADRYFKNLQRTKRKEKEQGITRDSLEKKSGFLLNKAQNILKTFEQENWQVAKQGWLSSLTTPEIKRKIDKQEVGLRIRENVSEYCFLVEAKTEESNLFFTLFTLTSLPLKTTKNWRGNEATMEEMKTADDFLDFIQRSLSKKTKQPPKQTK